MPLLACPYPEGTMPQPRDDHGSTSAARGTARLLDQLELVDRMTGDARAGWRPSAAARLAEKLGPELSARLTAVLVTPDETSPSRRASAG